MAALLEVENLSAGYGAAAVLHGLSLRLEQGEAMAVLGRNGAGKTTLLRHLSGELGSRGVRLFGRPPHAQAPAPLARRRAAEDVEHPGHRRHPRQRQLVVAGVAREARQRARQVDRDGADQPGVSHGPRSRRRWRRRIGRGRW